MQDLVAFSFTITGADAPEVFEAVARRVATWAWSRTREPAPDLSSAEGRVYAEGGYQLAWTRAEIPERPERGMEVSFTHPDEGDPGLRWRSTVEILLLNGVVRLSTHVSREATTLVLRPATVELGAPRLVRDLLGDYSCFAGSIPMTTGFTIIGPSDVDQLVALLRSTESDRVLPVVVVSPRDDMPRAAQVASRLAGLAHVVSLTGYLAYKRLQEAVPDAFTPPGGVRVYWPGFGTARDGLRHPYWTAARIEELGQPVEDVIFRLLSSISVIRIPREPIIQELKTELRERRRLEIQAKGTDVADYVELLDLAQAEINEKEQRIAALEQERNNYKEAFNNAQANLAAAYGTWRLEDGDGSDGDQQSSEALPPDTWAAFADRLPALSARTKGALIITDNAIRASRETGYSDPERMWEIMEALAEAAIAYRGCGGETGTRLRDWFIDEFGLEYAPFDSKLESLKDFRFENQTWSREPHIKVDDAKHGISQVGRVYFALDYEGARFIVDHIGSKLSV